MEMSVGIRTSAVHVYKSSFTFESRICQAFSVINRTIFSPIPKNGLKKFTQFCKPSIKEKTSHPRNLICDIKQCNRRVAYFILKDINYSMGYCRRRRSADLQITVMHDL